MTRVQSTETYEFTTTPLVKFPSGDLSALNDAARSIVSCIEPTKLGVVTDVTSFVAQHEVAARHWISGPGEIAWRHVVTDALSGIVESEDIKTIWVRGITDERAFIDLLSRQRTHSAANYHARFDTLADGPRKRIVRPLVGRLAVCLDDTNGFSALQGVIRHPRTDVYIHDSVDYYRSSTQSVTANMHRHTELVAGEDDYFLRGPVELPLQGDLDLVLAEPEQWYYLGPGSVTRIPQLPRTGNIEVAVDFKPGRDPFRQQN